MWSTFPLFGSTLLLCVMVVASYTFAVAVAAGANGKPRTLQAARFGAYGTVVLIAAAVICLAYAFVSHDFRLRYVAHYSDRSMALGYLFTALWGGQDGSLLWWLFLLSIYIGVCVKWMGKRYLQLQPYILATLMGVVLFFCVLMAFAANPFSTAVSGAKPDGEGLNPLLQNFYMIIHPPSLYTGFVGCTIPFAFGMAALVTGRLDHEWIVASRKWMLFAWMFLGIGNTLGMLWAYEELGWGGYWAWDPVENAAFMPFLSASAYVHSVMIQERRGMLKVWNIFLICLTFFMTIFGTFLTRSGAIASVHSFAQSSIGTYFVWFLVGLVIFALTLIFYRWPELREIPPSRELRIASVATGWAVISACAVAYLIAANVPLPGDAAALYRDRFIRVSIFALLVAIAAFAAVELVFRRLTRGKAIRSKAPQIESVLSREFTFLLNNFGLLVFLFFVLFTTTFPMITEALSGEKVSVGPPFYNAWVQPIGLTIFLLMGIGTLFGWKKTSPAALKRAFIAPTAVFFGTALLHVALGKALGFPAIVWSAPIYDSALGKALAAFNAVTPMLGIAACAFNAAIIVQEYVFLFRARARSGASKGTPSILFWLGGVPGLIYTLVTLSPQSRRRYGGYIVHSGIVLMFLGFTGHSWNVDKETTLKQGETFDVAQEIPGRAAMPLYTIKYVGSRREVDTTKSMIFADVDVFVSGKYQGRMSPARFIYKKLPDSPTTEVAQMHRVRDDLYLVVGMQNPETHTASFQVHVNPLVSWIWFGCLVLIGGSIICMWPQLEARESRAWAFARGSAAVAASVVFGILLAATPAYGQQGPVPHSGTVHLESEAEKAIFSKLRCMCGGCQRDLLSTCPCNAPDGAEENRAEIREQMRNGWTEQQILDAYVKKYGPDAVAIPPNTGAFRAIYAVPLAVIAGGAVGLAVFMRRWRGGGSGDGDGGGGSSSAGGGKAAPGKAARDAYDKRLDDELQDLE